MLFVDLKVLTMLLGQQNGYTKYPFSISVGQLSDKSALGKERLAYKKSLENKNILCKSLVD